MELTETEIRIIAYYRAAKEAGADVVLSTNNKSYADPAHPRGLLTLRPEAKEFLKIPVATLR